MICAHVGKEFPNMRHNDRGIKFIRLEDAVRTGGLAQGRVEHFHRLMANFYSLKKENSYWNGGIR